jgi:hypothetical protein
MVVVRGSWFVVRGSWFVVRGKKLYANPSTNIKTLHEAHAEHEEIHTKIFLVLRVLRGKNYTPIQAPT